MIFDKSTVLITGGTGSFGKAFTKRALETNLKKLIIFSRDELKQYEMGKQIKDDRIRFFIGDVRDRNRLSRAFEGVDYVVHAAALKQIPICENDPIEAIKTNVLGASNVIDMAIDRGVSKTVALSSDKAVNPINLYGATKLCADKLFVSGNSYTGAKTTKFSVVRYGNVMGSRGSVIPFFKQLAEEGADIPITDMRMTRFWITLDQAVDLVFMAFESMRGGEVYIPKIPSMRVVDLAKAIAPDCEIEIVGIRPGEKLHEVMITEDDRNVKECQSNYVIYPEFHSWRAGNNGDGKPVPEGFRYASDTNNSWLTIEQLKEALCLI